MLPNYGVGESANDKRKSVVNRAKLGKTNSNNAREAEVLDSSEDVPGIENSRLMGT